MDSLAQYYKKTLADYEQLLRAFFHVFMGKENKLGSISNFNVSTKTL
jgi:hypothetical protein